jgi:hypothetical protein
MCHIASNSIIPGPYICPVTGAGRGIISGGGCAGHSIVIPGVGPSNKMVKTLCSHKCQF